MSQPHRPQATQALPSRPKQTLSSLYRLATVRIPKAVRHVVTTCPYPEEILSVPSAGKLPKVFAASSSHVGCVASFIGQNKLTGCVLAEGSWAYLSTPSYAPKIHCLYSKTEHRLLFLFFPADLLLCEFTTSSLALYSIMQIDLHCEIHNDQPER